MSRRDDAFPTDVYKRQVLGRVDDKVGKGGADGVDGHAGQEKLDGVAPGFPGKGDGKDEQGGEQRPKEGAHRYAIVAEHSKGAQENGHGGAQGGTLSLIHI